MASLPANRQLSISQIPGAPAFMNNFVQALNPILGAYYDAINAGLTIPQNIPWLVKQIPVQLGETPTFAWPYSNKPQACILAGVAVSGSTQPKNMAVTLVDGSTLSTPVPVIINQWSINAGKISLDSVSGLQKGVQYTFTILAL